MMKIKKLNDCRQAYFDAIFYVIKANRQPIAYVNALNHTFEAVRRSKRYNCCYEI